MTREMLRLISQRPNWRFPYPGPWARWQGIAATKLSHCRLNDTPLARWEESKPSRKPENLLFEALFFGVVPWVGVGHFLCLWTTSLARHHSKSRLTLTGSCLNLVQIFCAHHWRNDHCNFQLMREILCSFVRLQVTKKVENAVSVLNTLLWTKR